MNLNLTKKTWADLEPGDIVYVLDPGTQMIVEAMTGGVEQLPNYPEHCKTKVYKKFRKPSDPTEFLNFDVMQNAEKLHGTKTFFWVVTEKKADLVLMKLAVPTMISVNKQTIEKWMNKSYNDIRSSKIIKPYGLF